MITTRSHFDDPDIGEFDIAYKVFEACGLEKEFPNWFDFFMGAPPSEKTFVYKAPDCMVWAQHITRKEYEDCPMGGAWLIFYLHIREGSIHTLNSLFSYLPYQLPFIAYARGLRGRKDLKYVHVRRIKEVTRKLMK